MDFTFEMKLIPCVSVIARVKKRLTAKKFYVDLPEKRLLHNICFCLELIALEHSFANSAILYFVTCDRENFEKELC